MALGKRIRNRRLELGMTQAELAKKAGVAEATINRYESGEIKNPRQPVLLKLIDALRVEPNYLMGWSDHAPEPVSPSRQVVYRRIENASDEQLEQLSELLNVIWRETEE